MDLSNLSRAEELINERNRLQETLKMLNNAQRFSTIKSVAAPVVTISFHYPDDEKKKYAISNEGLEETMISAGVSYAEKMLKKIEEEIETL